MRAPTLLLCAAALTGCASLPPEQRATETAFQALNMADMALTIHGAGRPDLYAEQNPILGPHPSAAKVALYFAASSTAHYAITSALVEHDAPLWVQRVWAWSGIGLEGFCVTTNVRLFKGTE